MKMKEEEEEARKYSNGTKVLSVSITPNWVVIMVQKEAKLLPINIMCKIQSNI